MSTFTTELWCRLVIEVHIWLRRKFGPHGKTHSFADVGLSSSVASAAWGLRCFWREERDTRRSRSDYQTSSRLFSCPDMVLTLHTTCFINPRDALTIVWISEPWQSMWVFFWILEQFIVARTLVAWNPPYRLRVQHEIIVQRAQT